MSERIYAVISAGVVVNTIKASPEFVALIIADHDAVIEITEMSPIPSIGWGYQGGGFIEPNQPYPVEPEPEPKPEE